MKTAPSRWPLILPPGGSEAQLPLSEAARVAVLETLASVPANPFGTGPILSAALNATQSIVVNTQWSNTAWIVEHNAPGTPWRMVTDWPFAVGTRIVGLQSQAEQGRAVLSTIDPGGNTGQWITNGAAAQTVRVASGWVNQIQDTRGNPDLLAVLANGTVLFQASTPNQGRELWVSDGTAAGTRLLIDAVPGPLDGMRYLQTATVLPDRNQAVLDLGDRWLVTDGTPHGSEIAFKTAHLGTPILALVGGLEAVLPSGMPSAELLFDVTRRQSELWVTDGTTPGTRLVSAPLDARLNPDPVGQLANGRALVVQRSEGRWSLWATDYTSAGTQLLASGGGGDGAVAFMVSSQLAAVGVEGRFVFSELRLGALGLGDTNSYRLWVTDGTVAGTQVVANGGFQVGPIARGDLGTVPHSLLYLDPVSGQLWTTDGTAVGTRVWVAPPSGVTPVQAPIFDFGDGRVVFTARDAAHGAEPWISDGTAAGTYLLADLVPGPVGSPDGRSFVGPYPGQYQFTLVRPGLALFITLSGYGNDLWLTDGTTAGTRVLLSAVRVNEMRSTGNGQVLLSLDPSGGLDMQLWVSDGTVAGTHVVTQLNSTVKIGQATLVRDSYTGVDMSTPNGEPGWFVPERLNATVRGTDQVDTVAIGATVQSLRLSVSWDTLLRGPSPEVLVIQATPQQSVDNTFYLRGVDRLQAADMLVALDTRVPNPSHEGGHTGQALAVAHAWLGHLPDAAVLSRVVAAADAAPSLAALSQLALNAIAPGISTADLLRHLHLTLLGLPMPERQLASLIALVGPGKPYEDNGEVLAAVAALPLNTEAVVVKLAGQPVRLDPTAFGY